MPRAKSTKDYRLTTDDTYSNASQQESAFDKFPTTKEEREEIKRRSEEENPLDYDDSEGARINEGFELLNDDY